VCEGVFMYVYIYMCVYGLSDSLRLSLSGSRAPVSLTLQLGFDCIKWLLSNETSILLVHAANSSFLLHEVAKGVVLGGERLRRNPDDSVMKATASSITKVSRELHSRFVDVAFFFSSWFHSCTHPGVVTVASVGRRSSSTSPC
jgi:hypothetical protein